MAKWIKVQNAYDYQYEYINADHIISVFQDSSNGKSSMISRLNGKDVPVSLIQFSHNFDNNTYIRVIGSPDDILNEEVDDYETPEQISDTLKSKDEPIMPAPKPTKTLAALWAESLGPIDLKAALCAGRCSNCPVVHKVGSLFCTDAEDIYNYMHREVEV